MTDAMEKALALKHKADSARQSYEMADHQSSGERQAVMELEAEARQAMIAAGLIDPEGERRAQAAKAFTAAVVYWKETMRDQLEWSMRAELAKMQGDPYQDCAKHYERVTKDAYSRMVKAHA